MQVNYIMPLLIMRILLIYINKFREYNIDYCYYDDDRQLLRYSFILYNLLRVLHPQLVNYQTTFLEIGYGV